MKLDSGTRVRKPGTELGGIGDVTHVLSGNERQPHHTIGEKNNRGDGDNRKHGVEREHQIREGEQGENLNFGQKYNIVIIFIHNIVSLVLVVSFAA